MNSRPELILGHMPFIGISYQSKEVDEQYYKRFSNISTTRSVVEAAIKLGIRRFASATPDSSPLSPLHLEVLHDAVTDGNEIEIIPCIGIPIKLGDDLINPYKRWATYAKIERRYYPKVKNRMKNDPIMNFREAWRRRLSTNKPYKEEHFRRLAIDWNHINDYLKFFQSLPVGYTELGSETDFLVMAGRFDLLGELQDNLRDQGFSKILLGTHHAGLTIPTLQDNLSNFHGYVTPLNPLGVMMFPTKQLAERAVKNSDKAVYAIKPLAGGRVEPRMAFTYVFEFDVEGCMIGVSSIPEMKEDIETAIQVLERPQHPT